MRKSAAVLNVLLLTSATLWSQSQPLPDKPQPQQKPKRILWLIPSVDVANARDPYSPLSARQKFNLFADTSFDRITFVTAAFDAGINQATDTPHGYGQGGEGYAKRYGAAVADTITSNFLGKFLFP